MKSTFGLNLHKSIFPIKTKIAAFFMIFVGIIIVLVSVGMLFSSPPIGSSYPLPSLEDYIIVLGLPFVAIFAGLFIFLGKEKLAITTSAITLFIILAFIFSTVSLGALKTIGAIGEVLPTELLAVIFTTFGLFLLIEKRRAWIASVVLFSIIFIIGGPVLIYHFITPSHHMGEILNLIGIFTLANLEYIVPFILLLSDYRFWIKK